MRDLWGNTLSIPVPVINGLSYIRDVITEEQEDRLIALIDAQSWDTSLKRRTQHYGYRYDYTAKAIDTSMYLGNLPNWLIELSHDIQLPFEPEQVIVNEYAPGQGIAQHIDCLACFGRSIASLSLGSTCIMPMFNRHEEIRQEIWLEPRSLLILDKVSRTNWTHGIDAKKRDVINGMEIPRTRRISITFRSIRRDESLAK